MGYNLQESLEKIINTMGTLLGLHPSLSLDNSNISYISHLAKKSKNMDSKVAAGRG